MTGNWSDLRSTPYGTRPVSAMVFRSLVTGVTASAAGLATPFIIQDLKIDIRTIINISATVGFFLTFVAIAVGWWADRHPRVPLLAWGGAISGLFSMLSGRATNAATLGPPWVLGGVASEMADVPTFSLTADYYPPEARGKVFTIFNLVGTTAALKPTSTARIKTIFHQRLRFTGFPPERVAGLLGY